MTQAGSEGPTPPLVVIADDAESIRTLLTRVLERGGFTPVAVPDGRQAVDTILALRPAAAVLDWHMPGLDGPAVVRQVRATPDAAATPLVLLTGRDPTQGDHGGADAVLGKPFEMRELMALLGELVHREG